MADLYPGPRDAKHGVMSLYCWPCKGVHQFALPDVERIVYTLAASEPIAYGIGADDPELGHICAADPPECPKETLKRSADLEGYAEYVEQGIECREAAP